MKFDCSHLSFIKTAMSLDGIDLGRRVYRVVATGPAQMVRFVNAESIAEVSDVARKRFGFAGISVAQEYDTRTYLPIGPTVVNL